MRFSLVLATVGRTEELRRFLASLASQTHRDFELVLVDQNPDDRVVLIIESYKDQFAILHLRSAPGLSRARNMGLEHVRADAVSFPDDDCWYPPNLLERVADFFAQKPEWDGITGRTTDEQNKPSAGRWEDTAGPITRFNVWRRGPSVALFLRRSIVQRVGRFDEGQGVGAGTPWGSAEETDYLLRALNASFRLYYDPAVVVHHPEPVVAYDERALARAYKYGAGMGRVLRKHSYPLWFVAYQWMRPLGGVLLAILKGERSRACYHYQVFRGRIRGWCARA